MMFKCVVCLEDNYAKVNGKHCFATTCGISICYTCYRDTDVCDYVYVWYDGHIYEDVSQGTYFCSINCLVNNESKITWSRYLIFSKQNAYKNTLATISTQQSLIQNNITKRFTKYVLPQLTNVLIKDVANIIIKYCI